MHSVELIPVEFNLPNLLLDLAKKISSIIAADVFVEQLSKDISKYYNHERGQYDASKILKYIEALDKANYSLVITSVDLYIPIFTYVFGLAKVNGNAAIISTHRLGNEFYGLPANTEILKERIIKEAVHEFGHLIGLRHCANFSCVMSSSTVADEIDIKSNSFCASCNLIVSKNET
ncbi:MAG: archaemetzincin family Zn-dependent metalloprotease [Bacteroidetes bacterium]|nr:archaemetzincin family Zn-dependent metalloprotease [Bacteroidota bacterium]MBU1679272.1 archaemetzincin family Zn-dependent metalloprotease [Bacteroidota bacterium]MBU2506508.1 archaemetzincin family Zn-dependent metalloprotease [Bacteroidota bacterium]